MMRRRGLTLLEVLAATVLLTMLAGACVPLLRQAMNDLRQPDEPLALVELTQLAKLFLADPTAFGIEPPLLERDELHLPWPDQSDRTPVIVHRLSTDAGPHDHAWVSFTSGEQRIFRWIAIEDEQESQP